MTNALSLLAGILFKLSLGAIALNEIRGFILAGPVLYGIYQSGGTWIAIYMGICSLGGIALSVLVPLYAAKRLKRSKWFTKDAEVVAA